MSDEKRRQMCMGCGSALEVKRPIEPLTKRNVTLTDRDWVMLQQLADLLGLGNKSAVVRQLIREGWATHYLGLDVRGMAVIFEGEEVDRG